MARVYISSTWLDLKVEREVVRNAILRLGHKPAGIEAYTSSETPQLARCLEDVATCDVYIGICAWRYGFVPPGEKRSITECEYDEAGRRQIPRLLFLLAASAPWPMERVDLDRGQAIAWRARLEQRHIVAYFSTADDLASKVIAALVEQLRPAAPVSNPPRLPYLTDRGRQEEAINRTLSGELSRRSAPRTQAIPPTVFISYSQSDARWKDRLALFLGVLQHDGLLHVWHDGLIQAGADWLPEIKSAMAEARVAILLVSVRFLTSDFVRRKEVPALMERRQREGLRVIPVIVSPCPWQKVAWLSAIQARPLGGRTLEGLRRAQQDEVLSRLAEEVAELLDGKHP